MERRKKPRWIGILVLQAEGLIQGNNPRGKGRSIRSDNNNPLILSHSRGFPLSTSLGVHISRVHPEVDLARGRDFVTSVDRRATSGLSAHSFRHRDKISSPDNRSWDTILLLLPFQHPHHHHGLREPMLLVVSSNRYLGDNPDCTPSPTSHQNLQ